MRILLGLLIIAIAVFFIVPMVAGGSTNSCQALEKYNISYAASNLAGGSSGPIYGMINSIGQASASGQITSMAEANAHPDTPTPVSCTASFWNSFLFGR